MLNNKKNVHSVKIVNDFFFMKTVTIGNNDNDNDDHNDKDNNME